MVEILTGLLALSAGIFAVVASIGVLRFPDALTRMHAASKTGSFAGSLALLAAAAGFASTGAVAKALFAIFFIFATAPIAAHLIGRASAWRRGEITPAPQKD